MEAFSAKKALKIMQVLHVSLTSSLILFGMVVVALNLNDTTGNLQGVELMLYVPGVMLMIILPFSQIWFTQVLRHKLRKDINLQTKLGIYQNVHLIRISLMEMVGLFSAVVCFISGNLYNMGVLLVVVTIFVMKYPTAFKLEMQLGLSTKEKSAFQ